MTDEELVLSAKSGNKGAEELLLNKYTPLVKAIAARFFLVGGESEDLVQEGMVGLYSAINGYNKEGANFSTYAYTCIRNAVVDAIKKSSGNKNSALNNFVPIVEIGDELSSVNPEDEIILQESRREFLQKISKDLSSLEFKVAVMYLDGMSVGEISSALQKEQKSVSNALSRAKSKLVKQYNIKE
ncbi:MAG: sigma-70 family RNA polymerase sigma factor [Clostridiales bacterium]|nr:sigma-70 family RNA polymerase sigma factor [Clostridiales bacterium]